MRRKFILFTYFIFIGKQHLLDWKFNQKHHINVVAIVVLDLVAIAAAAPVAVLAANFAVVVVAAIAVPVLALVATIALVADSATTAVVLVAAIVVVPAAADYIVVATDPVVIFVVLADALLAWAMYIIIFYLSQFLHKLDPDAQKYSLKYIKNITKHDRSIALQKLTLINFPSFLNLATS